MELVHCMSSVLEIVHCMSSVPESVHCMSSVPESVHCMSSVPESVHCMSSVPELVHGMRRGFGYGLSYSTSHKSEETRGNAIEQYGDSGATLELQQFIGILIVTMMMRSIHPTFSINLWFN